jgi:hypothetical protein
LNQTQTGKKPSQTGKNRAKLEKTEPKPNQTWFEPVFFPKKPNRIEPNQNRSFEPVSVWFCFLF